MTATGGRIPESVTVPAPGGDVRVLVWPAADAAGPGRAGRGRRPGALLAFHGWTDSAEVFQPLADALDPRYPVAAVDAPGHGRTALGPGDYVIADHATSALAVLAALPELVGRTPAVVAYGHSMGALTATRLAAARPRAVGALVLEEPARTTLRRPAAVAAMRTWLTGLRSGDQADRVAWAKANHPSWPAAELGPWATAKAEVDLAEFDRPHDWGEPLPVLLSEVYCPTLLVRGEPTLGGIVSSRAAARCRATCPGGLDVLALDAGHSPRRESPTEFVAALSRVLDATLPR